MALSHWHVRASSHSSHAVAAISDENSAGVRQAADAVDASHAMSHAAAAINGNLRLREILLSGSANAAMTASHAMSQRRGQLPRRVRRSAPALAQALAGQPLRAA